MIWVAFAVFEDLVVCPWFSVQDSGDSPPGPPSNGAVAYQHTSVTVSVHFFFVSSCLQEKINCFIEFSCPGGWFLGGDLCT